MPEFVDELADRITGHDAFWNDFRALQAAASYSAISPPDSVANGVDPAGVSKLLYSASVLSQSKNESNRLLAQSIALSAFVAAPSSDVTYKAQDLLADLGNFPGLDFVSAHSAQNESPPFTSVLKHQLLRSLNSIAAGDARYTLTDFQLALWRMLPDSKQLSISAPTSAGKSFVVREYLVQQALAAEKFIGVYIAPTRALLSEIHSKLLDRLPEQRNIRLSTVPSPDSEGRACQIFILTQERLQVLLSMMDLSIDLLVVDEAQGLADGSRGMILQDCLYRVRKINPGTQILLLSPGAEGFGAALKQIGISDLEEHSTRFSPVLQSRILVKPTPNKQKSFSLYLLSQDHEEFVAEVPTTRGLDIATSRLAIAALTLGQQGGSLVYATGPVDAEEIAAQLVADRTPLEPTRPGLSELSRFIKEYIHPRYSLAQLVLYGVAFHYGNMPSLLREAIETAFRAGDLQYLVCTTTLFQGINLPARNVFIDTFTRGHRTKLKPAELWNFAGRAGRLKQDAIGNVFLVDYDKWEEKPFDEPASYPIEGALSSTVRDKFELVIGALQGKKVKAKLEDTAEAQAAAGLLIANQMRGTRDLVIKAIERISPAQRLDLQFATMDTEGQFTLPGKVIENNWTSNAYGLENLAKKLKQKIADGQTADIVPLSPMDTANSATYPRVFRYIFKYVLEQGGTVTQGQYIASYALPWMKGDPYPKMLSRWVRSDKMKDKPLNTAIREGFTFFETTIRFVLVQAGKAYLDVLESVLQSSGQEAWLPRMFDFALALELGVASTSGMAFLELGISRITAVALSQLIPDSDLTPQRARELLGNLDIIAVNLSKVIADELFRLKLIPAGPPFFVGAYNQYLTPQTVIAPAPPLLGKPDED